MWTVQQLLGPHGHNGLQAALSEPLFTFQMLANAERMLLNAHAEAQATS